MTLFIRNERKRVSIPPQKNWNVWAAKLQTNRSSRKAGTNKVSKINKIFQYTSLHFDFGVNTLELSSFLCVFPLLSFFFLEWQPCHSYAEGFGFHQNHHTIYIWQFSIFLLIKKKQICICIKRLCRFCYCLIFGNCVHKGKLVR